MTHTKVWAVGAVGPDGCSSRAERFTHQYFEPIETDTMNTTTQDIVSALETEGYTTSKETKSVLERLDEGTFKVGNMLAKSGWDGDIFLKTNPHTNHHDGSLRITEDVVSQLGSLLQMTTNVQSAEQSARKVRWATSELTAEAK